MEQISCTQLKAWLDDAAHARPQLLDVREPQEFDYCHIEGAISMPVSSLPARVRELDPERGMVMICHHGMRSMQAALYLQKLGFGKLYNLGGGIAAWAAQVDPAMPVY